MEWTWAFLNKTLPKRLGHKLNCSFIVKLEFFLIYGKQSSVIEIFNQEIGIWVAL